MVFLAGFVAAERRAAEPVLPLSLFRNSVFTTTSLVGLIIGFALFGSVTYLPLFLQVVNGASPTASGLQLLPVMGGLLIASIGSGQLIARTGRYRIYPIVGTAVMVVGLYLLSLMDADTSIATASAYMFVLGLGLGLVMQVLVLAVQNAVPYSELGVATSGATLFRSIGGSFGASVLGAVFANRLTHNLAGALPGQPSGGAALRPGHPRAAAAARARRVRARLHGLPQRRLPRRSGDRGRSVRPHLVHQELPLRDTVSPRRGRRSLAVPKTVDTIDELARELSILTRREQAARILERLAARADVDLTPTQTWLLGRLNRDPDLRLDDLASTYDLDEAQLRQALDGLRQADLVTDHDTGDHRVRRRLTPAGNETLERLISCGRARLEELSTGWQPEEHPDLRSLIDALANEFLNTTPTAASARAAV